MGSLNSMSMIGPPLKQSSCSSLYCCSFAKTEDIANSWALLDRTQVIISYSLKNLSVLM